MMSYRLSSHRRQLVTLYPSPDKVSLEVAKQTERAKVRKV